MKTSIIIPVYNEEKTIEKILKKVLASPIKKEVIVVNDGSNDNSKLKMQKAKLQLKTKNLKIISRSKNQGKGAAVRAGLKYASGEMVLIQDADLEYDPSDYQNLIKPIIEKKAKVVYGSRWLGKKRKKPSIFYFGTQLLTWITNLLYGTKISDESCGYKVFETKLLKSLSLKSKRFEFCPEVTAKIAKKGVQIIEVPIKYNPRSISEGKKIKWRDGIIALYTLMKYRFDWEKLGVFLFFLWTIFILVLYIKELLCRGGVCFNWQLP